MSGLDLLSSLESRYANEMDNYQQWLEVVKSKWSRGFDFGMRLSVGSFPKRVTLDGSTEMSGLPESYLAYFGGVNSYCVVISEKKASKVTARMYFERIHNTANK